MLPNVMRNQIGTYDELQSGGDGSVTIYSQHESPGKDKEGNWLPAPKDSFTVTMRLYNPRTPALTLLRAPPAAGEGAAILDLSTSELYGINRRSVVANDGPGWTSTARTSVAPRSAQGNATALISVKPMCGAQPSWAPAWLLSPGCTLLVGLLADRHREPARRAWKGGELPTMGDTRPARTATDPT